MDFLLRNILVLFSILVLAGCISSYGLNYDARRYHDLGMTAERSADYQLARHYYEMALDDAKKGHGDSGGISMVTYNLGRVTGYLCNYDKAHKLLTEALVMEEKVTGPKSGITSMRLFELARLHYDQRQYEYSLRYFERGIPIAEALDAEGRDPIAFANVLAEYADALEKTNHTDQASGVRNKAALLREKNHGKSARFVPVRYYQYCNRKDLNKH